VPVHRVMESLTRPIGSGTANVGAGASAVFWIESLAPKLLGAGSTQGTFIHTLRFKFHAAGGIDWANLRMMLSGNSACSTPWCFPFYDSALPLTTHPDGSASLDYYFYGEHSPWYQGGLTNYADSQFFQLLPKRGTHGESIAFEWAFEASGCPFDAQALDIPPGQHVSEFQGVYVGENCQLPIVQAELGHRVEVNMSSPHEVLVLMVHIPTNEPLAELQVWGPRKEYKDLCASWQLPMGSTRAQSQQQCMWPDAFDREDGRYTWISPLAGIWYFMVPVGSDGSTSLVTSAKSAAVGLKVVPLTDFDSACEECPGSCNVDVGALSAGCQPSTTSTTTTTSTTSKTSTTEFQPAFAYKSHTPSILLCVGVGWIAWATRTRSP